MSRNRIFASIFLLFAIMLMVVSPVTANNSKQVINNLTGRQAEDVKIDTGAWDDATIETGVSIAEIVSKVSVLAALIATLLQLLGRVIRHPGHRRLGRVIMFNAVLFFFLARLAPTILFNM